MHAIVSRLGVVALSCFALDLHCGAQNWQLLGTFSSPSVQSGWIPYSVVTPGGTQVSFEIASDVCLPPDPLGTTSAQVFVQEHTGLQGEVTAVGLRFCYFSGSDMSHWRNVSAAGLQPCFSPGVDCNGWGWAGFFSCSGGLVSGINEFWFCQRKQYRRIGVPTPDALGGTITATGALSSSNPGQSLTIGVLGAQPLSTAILLVSLAPYASTLPLHLPNGAGIFVQNPTVLPFIVTWAATDQFGNVATSINSISGLPINLGSQFLFQWVTWPQGFAWPKASAGLLVTVQC